MGWTSQAIRRSSLRARQQVHDQTDQQVLVGGSAFGDEEGERGERLEVQVVMQPLLAKVEQWNRSEPMRLLPSVKGWSFTRK